MSACASTAKWNQRKKLYVCAKIPGSQVRISQGNRNEKNLRKVSLGETDRGHFPILTLISGSLLQEKPGGCDVCFAHLHIFSPQMSKAHFPKGKLVSICLVFELDLGEKKKKKIESVFYELLLAVSSLYPILKNLTITVYQYFQINLKQ